jgi:hypothetical protein
MDVPWMVWWVLSMLLSLLLFCRGHATGSRDLYGDFSFYVFIFFVR